MKRLILLMGLPGSGKSTLCYKELDPEKYFRISQDIHKGNRDAMIKDFLWATKNCDYIVVDRCNWTRKQRKDFIKVGKENGYMVECIYLMTDRNECITRISKRENHQTIPANTPLLKIASIVDRFYKEMQSPSFEEGFDSIEVRK